MHAEQAGSHCTRYELRPWWLGKMSLSMRPSSSSEENHWPTGNMVTSRVSWSRIATSAQCHDGAVPCTRMACHMRKADHLLAEHDAHCTQLAAWCSHRKPMLVAWSYVATWCPYACASWRAVYNHSSSKVACQPASHKELHILLGSGLGASSVYKYRMCGL